MQFNVSVIIPVFNAAQYLETAINSSLYQNEVREVIVINDGTACSVYSSITVETFTDAPFNSGNRGRFIYYKNDRISSGGINSGIGKFVIDKIEEMMKEFVIRHHEDNQ